MKQDLKTTLGKLATDPTIIRDLCNHLDEIAHQQHQQYTGTYQTGTQVPTYLMLRGLIPIQWQQRQQEYASSQTKPRKDTNTWSTKIITFMITKMKEAWTTRNQRAHSEDNQPHPHSDTTTQIAHERVRQIYSQGNQISNQDKARILPTPLQQKLQEHQHKLMEWVTMITPTMKSAQAKWKKAQKTGQTDIRTFAKPVPRNIKHNPPDP